MKKILLFIATAFLGVFGLLSPTPASALNECGGVDTAIINCTESGENGDSIKAILNIVLDVMSVGAGIIGAIGITIVGIQYLTAADNEEKVRKSKRRMFEIILGFAAYILLYALLKWLLPGFGN